MDISVKTVMGRVPVTILALSGELDASNFEALIDQAKVCYSTGSRDFLVDMGGITFMSSSGLVALHSLALIARGEQPHSLEMGWSVFHAIDFDKESGFQAHVKLLNPQPRVALTLKKTGLDRFFEVCSDRQAAVVSF